LESDVFNDVTTDLKNMHERIINLRHKRYAHSTGQSPFNFPQGTDFKVEEWAALHVALNPNELKREIVEFYYHVITIDYSSRKEDVSKFIKLITYTIESVRKKIVKCENALLDELESKYEINFLYPESVFVIENPHPRPNRHEFDRPVFQNLNEFSFG
jgi:hypothetical protein